MSSSTTVVAAGLPGGSDGAATRLKAAAENFPVAARLLPRRLRRDLMAVYGYARYVDDLGDELPGGPAARLEALDAAEEELDRAVKGKATHPTFQALEGVLSRPHVDPRYFADLIRANRQDQVVDRYQTFEELLGYCRLSANPVGRIVLALADVDTVAAPELGSLSDDVCTGLQIVEHIQDVAEDARSGRIYLPSDDMMRFAVSPDDLVTGRAPSPAFRRLVAFETGRAKALLESGPALTARLRGVFRLAVAGFAGGGLAQIGAIERASYDVASSLVKASRLEVATRAGGILLRPARSVRRAPGSSAGSSAGARRAAGWAGGRRRVASR